MDHYDQSLDQIVMTRLIRLNRIVLGIVLGIIFGGIVFIATNWLLLKGGPIGPDGKEVIGPHLWLLSQYFYGYSVTFTGSIIGGLYGFVVGFIIGYVFAMLYNWLITLKESRQFKGKMMPNRAKQNDVNI